VPVGHRGGAGVVGLAGEVDRQRPCGQIALATPTGARPQRPALLDVQLDERADAAQPLGSGPSASGRRRPRSSRRRA
jgi:hypothetical protein